jgi:ATP/maltotriose-dependent transcriptional regulator MalT
MDGERERWGEVLFGRAPECDTLDRLLAAVRAGESRALVVRGEAGVGKTALLEYLTARADGCRVARVSAVQSEMELAFAGLHQLCVPLLDRLERLPGPQRDALGTAFGLHAGASPDRFFVGLAVLGLLSEVAAERPLVCLVDDAQWLDRASAQALAFVARRLSAESVAVVFAVRGSPAAQGLARLPELSVEGLAVSDARALLGSAVPGPLDERVRDRIVDESGGNPLALLELPRGWSAAELAGGFGSPMASGLSGRIEESFARRLATLGDGARRMLLVAAAEPTGDPVLVWRAAEALGIEPAAATPATEAGLIAIGTRLRFRHPLVRSAVYRAASAEDRRDAHRALAAATDPEADPERRAWHRAEAAAGPDEDVAELIEAAVRTGERDTAADALERLSEISRPAGTDCALEARSRALLSDGDDAERLYREAIDRLTTPGNRVELARAHLIYGEWLRRERRRTDARDQLRRAHRMFEQMGLEAFADRAARELLASGETAPERTIRASDGLTPQEHQIARLAGDGLSNPEIGARLLISPRTVQYHLHKVFAKLGVSSRSQLRRALPDEALRHDPRGA